MTAEELSALIKDEIGEDERLHAILDRIREGKATFTDSELYAAITARITSQQMCRNVLSLDKREAAFVDITRERYTDTFTVFSAVQRILDAQNGIRIRPQEPGFDTGRARKIGHSLEDKTVPDSTITRRARSATENFCMSHHDDCMRVNAEFRARAGLQSYAIREGGAKCCDWCADVSGKYPANETPAGFWGRHDNCKCSILYESKRSGRQLLRGAKDNTRRWEVVPENAGAEPLVRLTHEQAMQIQQEKQLHRMTPGEVVNNPLYILTNGAERGTIELAKMANPNKSEQIRWLPKGKELTTSERRDLTEYAAAHGIILKGLKRTDVDIGLMKETIDIAASMLLRYPELNNNPDLPFTIKVVNGLDANTFAQTTRYSNTNVVQLNANAFRNAQKLSEEYDKLVKRNWFPQGTTYRSIVIHEIGHIIERKSKVDTLSIIKSIVGSDDYSEIERYLVENLSEYSVNGSSFTSEVIPEVFNAFYGSSLSNQFAADFMAEFRKGDINDRLQ